MDNRLSKAALAALLGLLLTSGAHAGLVDLVVNGEFEDSATRPARWAATRVTGWESSEGRIEIWNERFLWSRRPGSDGQGTGQHAEITWRSDRAGIWTSLVIPDWFVAGSDARFRFDHQNRSARGLWASVLVNDAQPLRFSASSRGEWALFDATIRNLSAGDEVRLLFESQRGRASGAHIDQVQFLVHGPNAVPLPGTAALLALGGAACGWRRLSRRRCTAGRPGAFPPEPSTASAAAMAQTIAAGGAPRVLPGMA